MTEYEAYVKALIELHRGLERQGPGDPDLSKEIIRGLPPLPNDPRIADIGCGAGAGTLILADEFRSRVKAVDFSREFLDELMERVRRQGLEEFIEVIECDMGNIGLEAGTIDLLWSEGAAYNITFEGALAAWRPLMATGGVAVISEMNYFSNDAPEIVKEYMKNAYPGIKNESMNVDLINASGFESFEVRRLPSKAWWDHYYGPLREKMKVFKDTNDDVMRGVIGETEEEMRFFEEHEEDFGYTFYMMRAV